MLAQHRGPARRALVRNGVVLLVVITVVLVAAERRFTVNPRRAAAEAATVQLDAAFRDVRAGRVSLGPEPTTIAPDIVGVRTEQDRWALASEVDDTCYAMWWGPTGRRHARIVPPSLPCEPRIATSDDPNTVARSALAADEDDPTGNWAALLPTDRIVEVWWIPLVIVAGWIGLSASTRIIVILVSRGRNLAHWLRRA